MTPRRGDIPKPRYYYYYDNYPGGRKRFGTRKTRKYSIIVQRAVAMLKHRNYNNNNILIVIVKLKQLHCSTHVIFITFARC